ncbi:P-loop containing nucleoside triphosphate hydrolase [Phytophthora cactorum]|nr:P-loop containing nucleoside triphosphate hydrolase [Phytophthora cactorum]
MEAESERSTDNHSTGDVVPEKLLAPKVSTYRLPRFSCRRLSSNSSFGDHDVLPRTMSMFPEPRELTKDDLTSADALMADDVFTMNATLSSDQTVYSKMPTTPKNDDKVIEIQDADDVMGGVPTISVPILLNGHPANDLAIRRCTGYCEQMDIHSDSATVREALIFSACCVRMPVSRLRRRWSLWRSALNCWSWPIADKIIRGSSTEQMKRVTIAQYHLHGRTDEWIDARSAKLIMNGVRKIADSGRTIVCTIHQPSTEVFNLFDSLLLLRRGGRMSTINLVQPHVDADVWAPLDFAERFLVSDQKVLMEEDLDQDGVLHPSSHLPELKFDTKRASDPRVQFQLLCLRFFRMYWRTPTYNLTRLFISVLLGCVFGVIYQGTDYSTYTGANSGIGLIFVSTIFLGLISFNSVMPVAADERTAFYRERASETYNALWYFVAGTLVEIPYIFFSSLLFCIIFYPSVGFTGYITFFYYCVAVASTLGALFSGIFMLFAGFNPPTGSIPTGYMWVHWISPPTYTISMLVSLVFADCSDGSTDGISCQTLENAPPTIGDMTLKEYVEETFDMKHSDIWRNASIMIVLIVVFRILALL